MRRAKDWSAEIVAFVPPLARSSCRGGEATDSLRGCCHGKHEFGQGRDRLQRPLKRLGDFPVELFRLRRRMTWTHCLILARSSAYYRPRLSIRVVLLGVLNHVETSYNLVGRECYRQFRERRCTGAPQGLVEIPQG